jgi:hypothetical protein
MDHQDAVAPVGGPVASDGHQYPVSPGAPVHLASALYVAVALGLQLLETAQDASGNPYMGGPYEMADVRKMREAKRNYEDWLRDPTGPASKDPFAGLFEDSLLAAIVRGTP